MYKLTEWFQSKDIQITEGYSQLCEKKSNFLKNIVQDKSIKNVMEIGFNGGHSAEIFLSSNPNIQLTSFDIWQHSYVSVGKEYIDNTFPNRHTLILGNSIETVPKYIKNNNVKFDIIYIDGGHTYDIAKGDLLNCKQLAHSKTIVIMDDTIEKTEWICPWTEGPTSACKEAQNMNFIQQTGFEEYSEGQGNSWGFYK